jgi:hypothetical protein
MITVDEVEAAGGDLGEQDGAREIGCGDGRLIQMRAAIVGNARDGDSLDGKTIGVSFDERHESRDVEFKDAVAKHFIARVNRTGLEGASEFQLGG